jgi:hypothetical protein
MNGFITLRKLKMDKVQIKNGVDLLIVDNMYTQDELNVMTTEMEFLTSPFRMFGPDRTGTAIDENGAIMKKNLGVFLDSFYCNRGSSDILRINRKLFSSEIMDAFAEIHPSYDLIRKSNYNTTLVSYYEESDHYKPHADVSVFSAVTWFFKEPRSFTGGEFIFTDHKLNIEIKNNRMVLFPGSYVHEVLPIKMNNGYTPLNGDGRYSMTQFLYLQ